MALHLAMGVVVPNLDLGVRLEPRLGFEGDAHYFLCRILGGEDPRTCPDNLLLWESIIKAYPLEGGLTLPDVLKRHKEELEATYSLVSQSLQQRTTPFSQGEILEGSLILAREYDEREWRFFVRIEEYLAFVTTLRNFLEKPNEQVFGRECLRFSSIPWLEEGRDISADHGPYKLIIDYLGSGNAGVLRSKEGLESYRKQVRH
ncbi:MAG: hypothetical protein KC548_06315 [Nanoarchaeota archaeon]|nr:hypothetical protein [Nanoarchaeota archaeon]